MQYDNITASSERVRGAARTITPEIATTLLEQNNENRPLRQGRVERFAADMAAGKWALNGETVKVDTTGNLLDGQHRLWACVESGVAFQTFIIYDLPAESFRTIDNGMPRTLGDLLSLRGTQNANIVGSACTYVLFWDNAGDGDALRITRPAPYERPTRNQKFDWLAQSDTALWLDAARMARRFKGMAPPSIVAAAYYIAGRSSPAKAELFFETAATGVGIIHEDDPAGALRFRLIRDRSERVLTNPWEKFVWFLKAWAAYISGGSIKLLRVTGRGGVERVGGLRRKVGGVR